jgi:hypothetical protein
VLTQRAPQGFQLVNIVVVFGGHVLELLQEDFDLSPAVSIWKTVSHR